MYKDSENIDPRKDNHYSNSSSPIRSSLYQ